MVNKVEQQIAHGTIQSNGRKFNYTVSLANNTGAGKDELAHALSGSSEPASLASVKEPKMFTARQAAEHTKTEAKLWQELIADELKSGKVETKAQFEAMEKTINTYGTSKQRKEWNKVRKNHMKKLGIKEAPKPAVKTSSTGKPAAAKPTAKPAAASHAALNENAKAYMGKVEKQVGKSSEITASSIDKMLGIDKTSTNPVKSAAESAGVFRKAAVEKALSQPSNISAASIDASLGIDKVAKSAKESAQVFAENGFGPKVNQEGARYLTKVGQQLSKPTNISAAGIDASLGIGKAAKSAEESMGVFIKREVEQILNQPSNVSADSINKMLRIGEVPKSAKESAEVFKEFGLMQRSKGRMALIIGGVALAAFGLGVLVSKLVQKHKEKVAAEGQNGETPAATTTTGTDSNGIVPPIASDTAKTDSATIIPPLSSDSATVTTPVLPETEENDNAEETDKASETEENSDVTVRTVKKGDNPWAIALEYLKNKNENFDYEHNAKDNKQLLDLMNKIINDNNVKVYYDKNGRLIGLIFPGDKLTVAA